MEGMFRTRLDGRIAAAALERGLAAWARGHRRRSFALEPALDGRSVRVRIEAQEPGNEVLADLHACLARHGALPLERESDGDARAA